MITNKIEKLILDLSEIAAIKFGEFTLKSGIVSPIYLDLRLTISYPKMLKAIANAMWNKIEKQPFDILCGVPYTAIPFATVIGITHNVPLIMCRKEIKLHGTKKLVEGHFNPGQTCLVVEDLITSGTSILETVAPLKEAGLVVKDVVVLIDREQNGKKLLEQQDCTVHSVFTLSRMLEVLQNAGRIEEKTVSSVKQFIQQHQFQ